MDQLEKRLAMAQLVSGLLKQEDIIKFGNRKVEEELTNELEWFVKKHLQNLLLHLMGEQPDVAFNNEEVAILKTIINRIKTQPGVAQ